MKANKNLLSVVLGAALLLPMSASSGEAQGTLSLIGKPEGHPPEPAKRGNRYAFNCGKLDARSMWGWRLELGPDSGLAFGGLATWTMQEMNGALVRNDDPRVHTQIRQGGKWIYIHEQLRNKNPLQPCHDRLEALVRPLKMVYGLARHIYFEGREEAAEKAYIEKEIAPKIADLLAHLNEARAELVKAGAGKDSYVSGQVAVALAFLEKVPGALQGLGSRTAPEKLLALRLARVALEQAAEPLDAEPPARALSMPVYDAKTGLFAVFGGEHFDYLTNDLWVFDPKVQAWKQRHPKLAPEPRADHFLASDAQGRLTVRGGYIYGRSPLPSGWDRNGGSYVHAGPDGWTYDLAADAWSGPSEPALCPPDTRHYRAGLYMPEYYAEGARPDAAAHEKRLAELPANTWVDLKPGVIVGDRCWGTTGYDAEREMIYVYNGGHSAYAGTDVAHYHMATNRWDVPVEVELPLNYIGASGSSVPGWSFNHRPWMTNHLWNSYRYHPGIKRLVVAGRYCSPCWPKGWGNPDVNLYYYDPGLADWERRVPGSVALSCMGAGVLYVPGLGMIESGKWLLDDAKLDWKPLGAKGKLPGTGGDFGGFVYDQKRSRVLYFNGGEYNGKPYSGEVATLAVPSLEVGSFKPEGSDQIKGTYAGKENMLGTWILREVVYHPGLDMFLFSSNLPGGYTAALDMKGNRWVGLKLPGPHPLGLHSGFSYDAKRDLIYSVGRSGEVSALRIDPRSVTIKTLAEIVLEAPKAPQKTK